MKPCLTFLGIVLLALPALIAALVLIPADEWQKLNDALDDD